MAAVASVPRLFVKEKVRRIACLAAVGGIFPVPLKYCVGTQYKKCGFFGDFLVIFDW